MREPEAEHSSDFKSFLGMEPEMFHELLERVGQRIAKNTTQRVPLEPGLKLMLLAFVDADYKFLWVDVGANGASSDADIFNRSRLEPALRQGTLGLPPPDPLPNDNHDTPYFIVGDDAFPLRTYLKKPYSHRYLSRQERICNYRFSRGRRVVENAFGILANRFRCLLATMRLRPANVMRVAKACLTLHNIMRIRYPRIQNADLDREDDQGQLLPWAWRDNAVMQDVQAAGLGPRNSAAGKEQRAYLKNYFNSLAGSVPWQDFAIDN